ncbi:hypothetical protein BO79DRAFT_215636 [Aspergillus costaricaensis CBS 115574]|uniref:Uncharacterized protein n=1 Tax=Aspergillus costaricaensis CBS 115574 TaxID=1448317 RepID=A0ACD1IME4_9EURO|nr:hypothetical protein BO79DRAFT_215636 [Aspergillus costaricaensis CBS 115574]RAK91283.1 hypothetical protein BO79DRAFT_215636 [Aspergillus costaricaensis CBS 115574]
MTNSFSSIIKSRLEDGRWAAQIGETSSTTETLSKSVSSRQKPFLICPTTATLNNRAPNKHSPEYYMLQLASFDETDYKEDYGEFLRIILYQIKEILDKFLEGA